MVIRISLHYTLSMYIHIYIYLGSILNFWRNLGVLGNWGRLCPFDVIFSANDSVFRAEHDPLLRTAYFLSKARDPRVPKRCSTLKIQARYARNAYNKRSCPCAALRGASERAQKRKKAKMYTAGSSGMSSGVSSGVSNGRDVTLLYGALPTGAFLAYSIPSVQ